MAKQVLLLDKVKVAAPCSAEWRFMYGDDRVRFCGQCSKNVYNLSAMNRQEAEDLIRRMEGHLCVRYYRRMDGTIITNNCPVGLRAIKEKYHSTKATIIKAALALLAYIGVLWLYKGEPPTLVTMGVMAEPRPVVMGAMAPIAGELIQESPPLNKSERFIRSKALFKVTPVFHSNISRKVGSSTAIVRVRISEGGEVEEATFVSGHPFLKEMAEEAARLWRFEPISYDGSPARVISTLTFRFGR